MIRLLPALLAFVVPLSAVAQTADVSTVEWTSITGDFLLGIDECNGSPTKQVEWTSTGTLTGLTIEAFPHTDSNCGEGDAKGDVAFTSTDTSGSRTVDLLSVFTCPSAARETHYLCIALMDGSEVIAVNSVPIILDTEAPEPPDVVSATAGDSHVVVEWSYDQTTKADDISGFRVAYRPATSTDTPSYSDFTSASGVERRVEDLENGVEYELWIEARDDAGNIGDGSESILVTPVESYDYWELYKQNGGTAEGCSSSGGSGTFGLLAAVLGLFLGLRRRRHLLGLLVVGGLLFAPTGARAEEATDLWHVEIGGGRYNPEADTGIAAQPYKKTFTGKNRALFKARLERSLWQGFGDLALGLGTGFGRAVGVASRVDGTSTEEKTVFNWAPLELTATYRFDWLHRELGIPFGLFGRLGLVYEMWWVNDATGSVATFDGNKGLGGQLGFLVSGGLSFNLNFIDPRLAKDFARSWGVDNTWLFAEVARMQVDGFGSGMNLSDLTWFVGVDIEF